MAIIAEPAAFSTVFRDRPEDVEQAAGMLGDAGIKRTGFLLLGGPDETRASVLESLNWVDSLRLEMVKLTVGIRICHYTRLAAIAGAEGLTEPEDNLMLPRFVIARGLEGWLRRTVSEWIAGRPGWVQVMVSVLYLPSSRFAAIGWGSIAFRREPLCKRAGVHRGRRVAVGRCGPACAADRPFVPIGRIRGKLRERSLI